MKTALAFDDVLVEPRFNPITSRNCTDISTEVAGRTLSGPIIAANMPSVCGVDMANAIIDFGCGIIHRMCSIEEQVGMLIDCVYPTGAAVGIGANAEERAIALMGSGAAFICIDVAHAHQIRTLEIARTILKRSSDISVIIGNIATKDAAVYFVDNIPTKYHDRVALKVGVGGGSVCTTRIMTGCGVPTLQSVIDVDNVLHGTNMTLIADGGIRNSGDIVKCLVAGADAVMLGSLLAGTDQSPGSVFLNGDKLVKVYRGAASHGEKKDFYGEAEYVEGAERLVPYKGDVSDVCDKLVQGVRSGMTYTGAANISELQSKGNFIQITPAGYRENLPHGII